MSRYSSCHIQRHVLVGIAVMCVAQLIRRYETPVTHYYIHSSTTHVETSSAGVFLLQCPTLLHRAAELQYLQ